MSSTERTGLPEILYEDNHLIAVNKRPGDIVQGDKTGDAPLGDLLKAYIKEKYKKPGEVFLGLCIGWTGRWWCCGFCSHLQGPGQDE